MWLNSTRTEEPHQGLTSRRPSNENWTFRKDGGTAGAWLSSARSVRSALKWDNERNPRLLLQVSGETASIIIGEEGGADVKSSCRLCLGLHTCYNGQDNGFCYFARRCQSLQNCSQWGLRSEIRPHERGIRSNRRSAILR